VICELFFIILAYGFDCIAELRRDLSFKGLKNILTISLILKAYHTQGLYKVVEYHKNKAIALL
jgi:hypothetical protein